MSSQVISRASSSWNRTIISEEWPQEETLGRSWWNDTKWTYPLVRIDDVYLDSLPAYLYAYVIKHSYDHIGMVEIGLAVREF